MGGFLDREEAHRDISRFLQTISSFLKLAPFPGGAGSVYAALIREKAEAAAFGDLNALSVLSRMNLSVFVGACNREYFERLRRSCAVVYGQCQVPLPAYQQPLYGAGVAGGARPAVQARESRLRVLGE